MRRMGPARRPSRPPKGTWAGDATQNDHRAIWPPTVEEIAPTERTRHTPRQRRLYARPERRWGENCARGHPRNFLNMGPAPRKAARIDYL